VHGLGVGLLGPQLVLMAQQAVTRQDLLQPRDQYIALGQNVVINVNDSHARSIGRDD
jgi:hypothetical protein